MFYVLALVMAFGVYLWFKKRKALVADRVNSHDLVYSSAKFSIYSKSLAGGRVYGVLSNSAPFRRSCFVFESSSLDTSIKFLNRVEDLNSIK